MDIWILYFPRSDIFVLNETKISEIRTRKIYLILYSVPCDKLFNIGFLFPWSTNENREQPLWCFTHWVDEQRQRKLSPENIFVIESSSRAI